MRGGNGGGGVLNVGLAVGGAKYGKASSEDSGWG